MLDLLNLPPALRGDVQVFTRPSPGTTTNTQWMTWQRPRTASMLYIFCLGSGGGGGGGRTDPTSGGGGGSGGSASHVALLVPAVLLPDRLYIQVAVGGVGRAPGDISLGNGQPSYVCIYPNTVVSNVLAVSCTPSSTEASGGASSLSTDGGAAGSGGSGPLNTVPMPRAGLGIWERSVGQIGQVGGASTTNGLPSSLPTTTPFLAQGGASGAGWTTGDRVGGACTAIANSYLSQQRPATPAAGANGHGSSGPQLWKPFFSFGGLGGSSNDSGAGAHGGHGGYGAGGGGGGGGTTGGNGGNGGDGLVIIVAW
jgi:hypothetical protein